jgi:5-methylcytosine-specific restriction endonuclease McrA
MTTWKCPDAEAQLAFLRHLQRLFEEGDFTATYKYALLMALVELAVERGDDSGAPLELHMREIAEKFARIYWPQTAPYLGGGSKSRPAVLVQNLGAQAAVVNVLATLRAAGASSLVQARRLPAWPKVIGKIASVVREMPVRYLQNLGGEAVFFLFEPPKPRGPLVLLPGVSYHLRRFQGFVQQMSKSGWLNHVRSNNRNIPILGQVDDLETFMFGSSRQSLQRVAEALRYIDGSRCFYCGNPLSGAGEVDHFVAWAQYPRDTGHNFVLAHSGCNRSKRDALAAMPHLERWVDRNERRGADIEVEMARLGLVSDWGTSKSIAHWAYSQGLDLGAYAWLEGKTFIPVDAQCAGLLE